MIRGCRLLSSPSRLSSFSPPFSTCGNFQRSRGLNLHNSHLTISNNIVSLSNQRFFSSKIRAINSLSNSLQDITARGVLPPPNADPSHSDYVSDGIDAITWYICGPTVYDVGHLGHARTYVCFDLINRIISDYFHDPLVVAMGVTDIDDKIINRAKELNIPWLLLSRYYEASFKNDLNRLNVKPPVISLRVTEHIPEIIAYIERIEKNGFAYKGEDGIYFDVMKFHEAGHTYGKLQYNNLETAVNNLLSDGLDPNNPNSPLNINVDDGSSNATVKSFKKHRFDFALWKFAKPVDELNTSTDSGKLNEKEPQWESKWGNGRPGWHIECSAMTAASLGHGIDIHAGGVDLKFPHHCNEIAQAEACFGYGIDYLSSPKSKTSDWCSLWLHTGHLHIQGLKMSKSLKNYISINDLFDQGYSADEFRMLCSLHHYRSTLDYTPDKLEHAKIHISSVLDFLESIDRVINNKGNHDDNLVFDEFSKLQILMDKVKVGVDVNESDVKEITSNLQQSPKSRILTRLFAETKISVNSSLRNDFNIPNALKQLQQLMNSTLRYLQENKENMNEPDVLLLQSISAYISHVYQTLGFSFISQFTTTDSGLHSEESAVHTLADVRGEIRNAVKSHSTSKSHKKAVAAALERVSESMCFEDSELLADTISVSGKLSSQLMSICDDIRDVKTKELGYILKDTDNTGGYYLRKLRNDEKE